MAANGGNDGGGCATNFTVLKKTQKFPPAASPPAGSFFLSGPSPACFGPRSVVHFEDANDQADRSSSRPFFRSFQLDENGDEDDDLDDYFRQPEKKRRLSLDQVKSLEKSFEVENKLEPERKTQLAKDLGLQPRQVAIWFQNRRARWKTKQLERDYQTLESSYDSLKFDYDALVNENDKLKDQINGLADKLQKKKERVVTGSADLSEKDTRTSREAEAEKPAAVDSGSEGVSGVVACKQDALSSARSDMFDSDSPHNYTDGVHSSLLESADSSYMFGPDQSPDLSQDEEDNNLTRNLFPASYVFPKLEDGDYSDPSASFEDHSFWSSWPY